MMKTIDEFLSNKGDLHDCTISALWWNTEATRLEISITDLNANFSGLPEYLGLQPGQLVFDGIKSIQIDVVTSDGNLRIYETSLRDIGDIKVIEFLFSPAGKLVLHFTTMNF